MLVSVCAGVWLDDVLCVHVHGEWSVAMWINARRVGWMVGPGGDLPYITDGDARRNFQKKPLKVTILGVAPANFIP